MQHRVAAATTLASVAVAGEGEAAVQQEKEKQQSAGPSAPRTTSQSQASGDNLMQAYLLPHHVFSLVIIFPFLLSFLLIIEREIGFTKSSLPNVLQIIITFLIILMSIACWFPKLMIIIYQFLHVLKRQRYSFPGRGKQWAYFPKRGYMRHSLSCFPSLRLRASWFVWWWVDELSWYWICEIWV